MLPHKKTSASSSPVDPASMLLVNTHALEDCISNEDWAAATALLEERDTLLLRLEREIDESCLQMIDVVQEAEARLMKVLRNRMAAVQSNRTAGLTSNWATRARASAIRGALGDC